MLSHYSFNNQFSTCGIGYEWYVMNITQTHQHLNVRFMRMFIEGVPEEDNYVNLISCSQAGDLGITPQWS